jgi:predicted lipoprotein with Yx(FWY)xxD motif
MEVVRFHHVLAAAAAGTFALAACGSSYSSTKSSPTTTPSRSTTVTARPATTALGSVLVDGNGRTLYGSVADTNGMPACTDACATQWPPVLVTGTSLPHGLDPKVFKVVARPDGSEQLEAGMSPLYRFAGDAKAGDTNGQGVAGFFVATPGGALNKEG